MIRPGGVRTIAVKVIVCPTAEESGEEISVVVVGVEAVTLETTASVRGRGAAMAGWGMFPRQNNTAKPKTNPASSARDGENSPI